jgi:hypothetical protein
MLQSAPNRPPPTNYSTLCIVFSESPSAVALLLARGARWNTRSLVTGRSALDELRVVLGQETTYKKIYKIHNVAELRKHVLLDIDAEGVDELPDFNPFEMVDIRATRGNC